jgi:hypothetical protein
LEEEEEGEAKEIENSLNASLATIFLMKQAPLPNKGDKNSYISLTTYYYLCVAY